MINTASDESETSKNPRANAWSIFINTLKLNFNNLKKVFLPYFLYGIVIYGWKILAAPVIYGIINDVAGITIVGNLAQFGFTTLKMWISFLVLLKYKSMLDGGDATGNGVGVGVLPSIRGKRGIFMLVVVLNVLPQIIYPAMSNIFYQVFITLFNISFFIILVHFLVLLPVIAVERQLAPVLSLKKADKLMEDGLWRTFFLVIVFEFVFIASVSCVSIPVDNLILQTSSILFMVVKVAGVSTISGLLGGLMPALMLVLYYSLNVEEGYMKKRSIPCGLELVFQETNYHAGIPSMQQKPAVTLEGGSASDGERDGKSHDGIKHVSSLANVGTDQFTTTYNKCPRCNSIVLLHHSTCQECGLELKRCVRCASLVKEGGKRCQECGMFLVPE
ncbi:MAG: zinc ribbon domain-containing protein [Promethearchaeota archaeon]